MFKIRSIWTCATCDYSFIHTVCKYFDMASVGSLHWGYLLKRWRHECDRVNFLGTFYSVFNFLVEISTFKQAIKLTFGPKKFGNIAKFRDLNTLLENVTWSSWLNYWPTLFIKKYPQYNFQIYLILRNL